VDSARVPAAGSIFAVLLLCAELAMFVSLRALL
jgi:hypothetical protein